MRTLFYKGILLLISIMLIKQLANIISPAYDQRDFMIAYKTEQLIHSDLNTIFLGTSRIKRGVIPAVVDSINPGLRSYNFGENHFAFPYTCKWVEDNLRNLPDVEVLIIELTGDGEKILDLAAWWPYASTSVDLTNGWGDEQKTFATLREKLVETYLSPAPNITTFLHGADSSVVNADVREVLNTPPGLITPKNDDLSLRQTNIYTKQAVAIENTSKDTAVAIPSAYRFAIDRLKEQCEAANVQLILLAPPIFSGAHEVGIYHGLISYTALKEITLLTINHPLLFEASHRVDYRHFNQKGARLYSELLGEALKEVLSK